MTAQLEKIIYGGRLLLLPMYLGLIIALVAYALRFCMQAVDLLWNSVSFTDNQILVSVLHLLDIIMVSHLIVMIMIGGYVLFISTSCCDDLPVTPNLPKLKWLGHINPGALKVKMSMSILGVSNIHLLEAFVNANSESAGYLTKLIIMHLVFVISTMAVAWVNRFAFQHNDSSAE